MRRAPAVLLLLAASALVACKEPPPQREIDAAARQVEEARAAGAGDLAPQTLREAEAALARAREMVEAKDYRAALSATAEAGERARAAVQGVRLAREQEKGRAEITKGEAEAALDEAAGVRETAIGDKIPEEAFADLDREVAAARESLAAVTAALDKGDVVSARETAAAVKSRAAALPSAYREARTQWEAAHPKGRHAKAVKPPRKGR